MEVHYRALGAVLAGEVVRYTVTYTPTISSMSRPVPLLWLQVRNAEPLPLRAAFLAGPYTLYVDVRCEEFDVSKPTFVLLDQPLFDPNVAPGQSFTAELATHTFKRRYVWVVDVVSQMIFSHVLKCGFEVVVGGSMELVADSGAVVVSSPDTVCVTTQSTMDLWNVPPPTLHKPIHLVVVTHGLHLNVGADMLYMKEQIEKHTHEHPHDIDGDLEYDCEDNIIVRGFHANVCKTERGIKYLGLRLAEYIYHTLYREQYPEIRQISFVGHSLGGLVQTFAIAYLHNNFPDFFEKVVPINFVAMALPLLGVAAENPAYVSVALLVGVVGRSGQDLGLTYVRGHLPLLVLLPTGPAHEVMRRFKRRTVYANASCDGVVPIRTSALLFLDYRTISEVMSKETANEAPESPAAPVPISMVDPLRQPSAAVLDERKRLPDLELRVLSTPPNQACIEPVAGHTRTDPPSGMASPNRARSKTQVGVIPVNMPDSVSKQPSNLTALPLLTALLYLFPQAQAKPEDGAQPSDVKPNTGGGGSYSKFQTGSALGLDTLLSLPKALVFDVLTPLLLPPTPSLRFINDPGSRPDVVLHDRMYFPWELPAAAPKQDKGWIESLDPFKRVAELEDQIARGYHHGKLWRKVIVRMEGDAHNNMIVRRRFANAYGWQVVHHMVTNHFGHTAHSESPVVAVRLPDHHSTEVDITDFNALLVRDPDTDVNVDADTDAETDGDAEARARDAAYWLDSGFDAREFELPFASGPTSLVLHVGELVQSVKTKWRDYALGQVTEDLAKHKTQALPKGPWAGGGTDDVDDMPRVLDGYY